MACWSIKAPWSYETGSSIDVTSVNFNSKIVHEDDIFGRQDILHFLPRRIQFISNNMQDPETPDGQFKHFVVQNASDLINQFVYMMKLHIPARVVSKKLNLFCILADNSVIVNNSGDLKSACRSQDGYFYQPHLNIFSSFLCCFPAIYSQN